jgi:hypothetical protein
VFGLRAAATVAIKTRCSRGIQESQTFHSPTIDHEHPLICPVTQRVQNHPVTAIHRYAEKLYPRQVVSRSDDAHKTKARVRRGMWTGSVHTSYACYSRPFDERVEYAVEVRISRSEGGHQSSAHLSSETSTPRRASPRVPGPYGISRRLSRLGRKASRESRI